MRLLPGSLLLCAVCLALGCGQPADKAAPAAQPAPAAAIASDSAAPEDEEGNSAAEAPAVLESPQARLERLIRQGLASGYLDSAYAQPFSLQQDQSLPRRTSMLEDSGYSSDGDDENNSGLLTDTLLSAAGELYGTSDMALLPWLNLEAEHLINLRKLYGTEEANLYKARRNLTRARVILDSLGVTKQNPTRLRIEFNQVYLKYFDNDLSGAAEALQVLIPQLKEDGDSLNWSLALELLARCRLGLGPEQQYSVNGFRFYEPEQYRVFLHSLDRNEASKTLGLLLTSLDLLAHYDGETSLEIQNVLELLEDCYYTLNQKNDYLVILERRLFENYCHCRMDCEFQIHQTINVVYDNVERSDLQQRLNALRTYHPAYVSSPWRTQNWEPFKMYLTESYKAWIMNLAEGKNRPFRERYNDILSSEREY